MRGWLGNYTAESILSSLWRNIPFFCHPKIDYEDPDWLTKAQANGKLCLGSLRMSRIMCSPMRPNAYPETDAEVLAARAIHQDRTDVECMSAREFLVHHGAPPSVKR